jgi:hypothetical protein
MNRGRYRWLLRLAAVLVAGLAFLLSATGQRSNVLTVENRSGQRIALLRVTITGKTSSWNDVPPGAEVSTLFRIKSDDHFAVEGRLEDGTMIRGQFGYVTTDMSGERARLIVLPGGEIKFHQGDRPLHY